MFLRYTLRAWRHRSYQGAAPGRRPASYRPVLEDLEGRTLPSKLTVTNITDSGPGSLRAALADAQSDDTIDFAPYLAGLTIQLTSGELVIDKSLDIEGLGADQLAISGSDTFRVFDVTGATDTVTIAGLTIAHGLATQGAGINHLGGTLTVAGCTLTENEALADVGTDGKGGGLFNAAGASVTVTASTLNGNRVVGQANPGTVGLPGGLGGALYNEGDATIADSTFQDNLATNAGGGSFTGGRGAAVWNGTADPPIGPGATLTVTNSTFVGNQALGGPGSSGIIGGRALGGAFFNRYATLAIRDSTLTDNEANAGPSGAGAPGNFAGGGAIANTTGGSVAVVHSVLAGNAIVAGDAGQGTAGGGNAEGGGLYNEGVAAVTGTVVSANTVRAGAGNPGGFGFGGGMVNFGTLTVDVTRVTGNQVSGGAGSAGGAGGNASGGALRVEGLTTVRRSLLAGNQVVGGAGGVGMPGGDALGGAIRNFGLPGETDSLTVAFSVVVDNQVVGGAAGPGATGGNGRGGAIDNEGPTTLTVRATAVVGNVAIGGQGDTGGDGLGGGLYIAGGPVCLANSLIARNQAQGGAGTQDGAGVGGGVYIASGNVGAQNTRIAANLASTSDDDVFGDLGGGCSSDA
jgi:hypothetical protein